ncbi:MULTISPECIES: hypothetical protein [Aureimonas]|uniref:Uncharacterized protein n=1 Tax=Aureimonas ureilytica TaxID=401562 RepID=A0A175RA90_9HYPH|nr:MULTISPECIES: hypothetical protein [Aureimonas]KTQ95466.1 hypothetical protein NS226_11465 [Aureimonas ureilytica]
MTIERLEDGRPITHGKPMGPKLRFAIAAFLVVLFGAMLSTLILGAPTASPSVAEMSMSQQSSTPTNPSGNP